MGNVTKYKKYKKRMNRKNNNRKKMMQDEFILKVVNKTKQKFTRETSD
jgi:hypothetical protein